jgi:hypothetical protein
VLEHLEGLGVLHDVQSSFHLPTPVPFVFSPTPSGRDGSAQL